MLLIAAICIFKIRKIKPQIVKHLSLLSTIHVNNKFVFVKCEYGCMCAVQKSIQPQSYTSSACHLLYNLTTISVFSLMCFLCYFLFCNRLKADFLTVVTPAVQLPLGLSSAVLLITCHVNFTFKGNFASTLNVSRAIYFVKLERRNNNEKVNKC